MLRRMSAAINRPAPMRVASTEGGEASMAGSGGGSSRKPIQVKSMNEIEAEIEA
jgi:hypothetical protein